jgi:hypothetical protein
MKKFKFCLGVFLSLIGLMVLSSSAFALQYGNFNYTVNPDSTVTITFNSCPGELTPTAVIPSTIDGMPVVGIGAEAFEDCTSLTGVTIPNSVTSIGAFAFNGCTHLTNVTIPASVTSMGDAVFVGLSSLNSIDVDPNNTAYSSQDGVLYNKNKTVIICYPGGKSGGFTIPDSVTSIDAWAFYRVRLTSLTIPDNVTSIGTNAFGQSSLTNVTIGNGVTVIEGGAFYNCPQLTSMTIPNSVTSIGDWAFYNCIGLPSVTIGNSVKSIGDNAFYHCYHLTSVTIPASVTSIGESAFELCSGLTKAYFSGNAPSMGATVFDHCSICYTAGATGFTTPYWCPLNNNCYPASVCGGTTTSTTTSIPPTTTTTTPTVIELSSFTATPKASEAILQWNTESETDNAGFNLYRSESENDNYSKINTSLIPAKGSSTQGASYEFTDTNVQNRKTYYYKLEDIDLNGTSTMHGPVSATPRLIFGIFGK